MINLSLISERSTMTGHQTFAVRAGWLKKGVDMLMASGPEALSHDDALVTLGVGKNMVQSIRHWLLAMGMATGHGRGLHVTELGKALFADHTGWDPYLEDDATLWLLHWLVTSPLSPALSWVWSFHEMPGSGFTKQALMDAVLMAASAKLSKTPGKETVSRDVDCLLHTYVTPQRTEALLDTLDCPLQALDLVRVSETGKNGEERRYRFQIGPKPTLPPHLFFHSLASYWAWRKAGATLTVQDIAFSSGGPGQAFKLDEDSVLEYLDYLEEASEGGLRFDDAALTRQVVLTQENHPCLEDRLYFLRGYYSHV
jgi:hypothetical protein